MNSIIIQMHRDKHTHTQRQTHIYGIRSRAKTDDKERKKNDYFDDADATTAATLADDVHV